MSGAIDNLVRSFEGGRLTRRELVAAIAALAAGSAIRIADRLKQQGIEARIDTNPANRTSGGDQLYFNDPDGAIVQLSANGYQG